MKKIMNAIDNIFIAISFAEEGVPAYSQTVINEARLQEEQTVFCKTM